MKILLLPIVVLTAQPLLAAEDGLLECRQMEDDEQRVACYDEYVDSRNAAPTAPPVTQQAQTVPDAQSLFGETDAEAKRIVETTLAIEQIDRIEATVTETRKSASKKLTVALDNGQIWRQLDGKPFRLKRGEAVVIRKASLGSYLMEKEAGSRPIRVKRID